MERTARRWDAIILLGVVIAVLGSGALVWIFG